MARNDCIIFQGKTQVVLMLESIASWKSITHRFADRGCLVVRRCRQTSRCGTVYKRWFLAHEMTNQGEFRQKSSLESLTTTPYVQKGPHNERLEFFANNYRSIIIPHPLPNLPLRYPVDFDHNWWGYKTNSPSFLRLTALRYFTPHHIGLYISQNPHEMPSYG